RGRESPPVGGFPLELLSSRPRERVELRAPVVLGRLPLRLDPALLLELVQCGIERAVADLKHLAGHLLQALADRPAVERLQREDLQQEQVECSLYEVGRFAHW